MINEQKIKLAGIANISTPLILGQNYDLTMKNVECRKIEETPNDDGSSDKIYKLLISELSEINIIAGRDILKAKKKGSQSKRLRWEIQKKWELEGGEEDFDDYYAKEMSEIIKWFKITNER